MQLPPRRSKLLRRPSGKPPLMAGARVTEHHLENGLRVLVAERHADPVVSTVLLYRAGARTEVEREAGLSHFLEHMMFKGTPTYGKGEVDRLTTQLGGQNNAFTGYDHTAYWFELASDRWERALEIEADRMQHLLLDPEEFDAERAVVLEELSMGEDEPWRVLGRHVEAALFPHHPYGRPIIGFPETLRSLTPDDMRGYYRRFYHPACATLVVCGDIEPRAALAAVRQRFERLPAGPVLEPVAGSPRVLVEPPGEKRLSMRWSDAARRLVVAWPTARVGSPEDDALDLAVTVLANGRMSRLWRRLVLDEGLATSISASNDSRVEAGVLWIFAETAQEADPAALERALHEEIAALSTRKVTADELERARALLLAGEAFDGETVSDVAEGLGEWAVDDDWRRAFDGGARHRRVSAEDLRATAARLLLPERRVVGWCFPKEEAGKKKRAVPKRAARGARIRRKARAARRPR